MLQDVAALEIAVGAGVRHAVLVQALVFSDGLHPGEVPNNLTLRKVRVTFSYEVTIDYVLLVLAKLLNKLLIQLFSFLFLLHVQEAPWCAILAVLAVRDHADDYPDGCEYCWSEEILARLHINEHNLQTHEESQNSN